MNESCHTYEWVMSHIWMSHVTHMNESMMQGQSVCLGMFWLWCCIETACGAVWFSVLQCGSVCCSVVQCGAVWCSVLQCVALRCSALVVLLHQTHMWYSVLQWATVCYSVVQCGAVWCSVVQCGAVWCSVVQCGAVWCSVFQCMQCVAVFHNVQVCFGCAAASNPCFAVLCLCFHINRQVTHRNASCHTLNKSRHTQITGACRTHMNTSCHTYECDTRHMWMRYITYVNEPRRPNGWVMSHTHEWVMSHMSRYTCEWVTSRIRKRHIPHTNDSLWLNHVKHMDVSCHTYRVVKTHRMPSVAGLFPKKGH